MNTLAGKGEHRVYRVVPQDPNDTGKLTARNHYVGVEAVAWFINKESSWFTDRMASGTLDIKLAGGLERYQAALGTFELKGGSRIAPVFERPVIPDRNYRGGPITFGASLTAIKRDTALGGLLKSAANASLGIAAGMVATAGIAGPATLLTAAGEELISGVQRVLTDTGEKREPLFDFNGLEYNLFPEQVVGPAVFLLMHRGMLLDETKLTIKPQGQLLLPYYNGVPLEDGAWLLLRVRRADEYSGVREWSEDARALRASITSLVNDVANGFRDKDEALKEFQPTTVGSKTLFDQFTKLRTIIYADGVLSEREASFNVGRLTTMIASASRAIRENNLAVYDAEMKNLLSAIAAPRTRGPIARGILSFEKEVFLNEVSSLVESRKPYLAMDENSRRVAPLGGPGTFQEMHYLRRNLEAFSAEMKATGHTRTL
jgi:hypothetical protein